MTDIGVNMVTPLTSHCGGGNYKASALLKVWEGWHDDKAKWEAVAALCDNAYYGSHGRLKDSKYMPGWFIARRIIAPRIFQTTVCYIRPPNMVNGVVWIEKCTKWEHTACCIHHAVCCRAKRHYLSIATERVDTLGKCIRDCQQVHGLIG